MKKLLAFIAMLTANSLFAANLYFYLDEELSSGECAKSAYRFERQEPKGVWHALIFYNQDEKLIDVDDDIVGIVSEEYSRNGIRIKIRASITEIDGNLVYKKSVAKANRRFRWFDSHEVEAILEPSGKLTVSYSGKKSLVKGCHYKQRVI
jgi:hypothetical protein